MAEKKDQKQVKVTGEEDKKAGKKGVGVDKEKAKKLKEDMDKLLDEIDDILEEGGEDFVKSYVQRGGE